MATKPKKKSLLAPVINLFGELVNGESRKAGWWDGVVTSSTISEKLALIHSEISEALEGHRRDVQDDHLPHRKMIEVELADAMIRIADLATELKLDLGGAIEEKMEYNRHRADHKLENRQAIGGKKF